MSVPVPVRPRRSRARVLLPAAIVMILAAAVAVPWLLSGRQPSTPPRAGARPATASPPGTGRAPARAASPSVDTGGWRAVSVDGAPVPESPADGPLRIVGATASGFADTASGAVLAAVNIMVRASGQDGPRIFSPTISSQVTGTWKATLLAAAWQEYQQSGKPPADGGPSAKADVSVTAFQVTSWSAKTADITLLATSDSAAYAQVTVPVQLTWSGGDWRLIAPASGNFDATAASPGLPEGFTRLPALPSKGKQP